MAGPVLKRKLWLLHAWKGSGVAGADLKQIRATLYLERLRVWQAEL